MLATAVITVSFWWLVPYNYEDIFCLCKKHYVDALHIKELAYKLYYHSLSSSRRSSNHVYHAYSGQLLDWLWTSLKGTALTLFQAAQLHHQTTENVQYPENDSTVIAPYQETDLMKRVETPPDKVIITKCQKFETSLLQLFRKRWDTKPEFIRNGSMTLQCPNTLRLNIKQNLTGRFSQTRLI